ncbi:MAG: DegT/DnrJ/EryC1/StrS family aminotransferase, partial [Gammaproteobacteria bacterium]|nr:DegT/DnrJ/EryC1/StrS family aminotransferase [Gammaproteobacteria bacterium]
DMNTIMSIAKKHNLLVIEDCAQSYGAKIGNDATGGIGLVGCHSFFPSKNLGCYGDGGMVTTNDDAIAEQIRIYRNHGSSERYHHDVIGYNSRLDELQAVILRIKLQHIDEFNTERRRVAHSYSEQLKDVVTVPFEDGIGTHVYHQYTVLTDKREQIMAALSEKGIANAIYYPIPLHQQKAFEKECAGISLPVTEDTVKHCMSLPVFPEMTEEQIKLVCDTIKSAV